MAQLDRETKKQRRISRILTPLLNRREFTAALTAAGLSFAEVSELAAAPDMNYREALHLAYLVAWEASGQGFTEDLAGYPNQIAFPDPEAGAARPGVARERLKWMVARAFHDQMKGNVNNWFYRQDYVLMAAVRVGLKARQLATAAGATMIDADTAERALRNTRATILEDFKNYRAMRRKSKKKPDDVSSRAEWCENIPPIL